MKEGENDKKGDLFDKHERWQYLFFYLVFKCYRPNVLLSILNPTISLKKKHCDTRYENNIQKVRLASTTNLLAFVMMFGVYARNGVKCMASSATS